jgi:PncC family amidohydrolase
VSVRRLVAALKKRKLTLAVAESCTGGMLGGAISSVAGASEVFRGATVAYADDIKHVLLNVPRRVLQVEGAVSAGCVEAMAHGARKAFTAHVAIAVTGIAGPGGARPGKPVGTVWFAVSGPGDYLHVHRERFKGGREAVRKAAVAKAIALAVESLAESELPAHA